MNRPGKSDYIYITIAVVFILLSVNSIWKFVDYQNNSIKNDLEQWKQGLDILISDMKKSVKIDEVSDTLIRMRTFKEPPVISSSRPSSIVSFDNIYYIYTPTEGTLKKRKGNSSPETVLDKLETFSIKPLYKEKKIIGIRFFILFSSGKKIPVEFSVFPDYVYSRQSYKGYFDFIDDNIEKQEFSF